MTKNNQQNNNLNQNYKNKESNEQKQESHNNDEFLVLKIHPKQWNIWINQPETQIFFQYLKDKVSEEAYHIAYSLTNGNIIEDKSKLDKISMLGLAIRQILETNHFHINEFYKND